MTEDARCETGTSQLRFGVIFGVGIIIGALAIVLIVWGILGTVGAATSVYDEACSTQEVAVEYDEDEPVVHIEDREPAWFCVTTSENSGIEGVTSEAVVSQG